MKIYRIYGGEGSYEDYYEWTEKCFRNWTDANIYLLKLQAEEERIQKEQKKQIMHVNTCELEECPVCDNFEYKEFKMYSIEEVDYVEEVDKIGEYKSQLEVLERQLTELKEDKLNYLAKIIKWYEKKIGEIKEKLEVE